MITVALLGLLATMAVPAFLTVRATSRKTTCIANLRQIENAKQAWANEMGRNGRSLPTDVDLCGPDKYLRKKPVCLAGGDYTIGVVDTKAKCSLATSEEHSL